jgi:uncharacterized phage-associated protein
VYLLSQCEDITPLALQKALYYIQGFYYAFYKTFLFSEECEAWVHGPVYRDIYFRYRDYRFDPIEGNDEFDDTVFSSSEKAILDSVIKNVCCYSGKVLEKFTHSEAPWLATRGDLPETVASDRTILKKQIGDYFSAVKEKYNMINPNDIKADIKVKNTDFYATHKVKSGENLSQISRKYYGDPNRYRDIASYNNINNPDKIEPGQELKIPNP